MRSWHAIELTVALLVAAATAPAQEPAAAERIGSGTAHPETARERVERKVRESGGHLGRAWWRPVAERGWLGVALGSRAQARQALDAGELPASWAEVQNLPWVAEEWNGRGALVREVFADTPADRAGILPGDVVVSFNGIRTASAGVLVFVVQRVVVGYDATVELVRDGEPRTLLVEIGLHPEDARRLEEERAAERMQLGAGDASGQAASE